MPASRHALPHLPARGGHVIGCFCGVLLPVPAHKANRVMQGALGSRIIHELKSHAPKIQGYSEEHTSNQQWVALSQPRGGMPVYHLGCRSHGYCAIYCDDGDYRIYNDTWGDHERRTRFRTALTSGCLRLGLQSDGGCSRVSLPTSECSKQELESGRGT